jgi:hypothetical protein
MRYRVDASRSRFVAQAFAKGLLSAFGHNPRLAVGAFEGDAEFNPAAPDSGRANDRQGYVARWDTACVPLFQLQADLVMRVVTLPRSRDQLTIVDHHAH